MANRKTILKWTFRSLWICIGAGSLVLLVMGMRKKDSKACKGVEVTIRGAEKTSFVDEKDVLHIIETICGGKAEGQELEKIRLRQIEAELEKNSWIKDAELFFDNTDRLQVKVTEREPVARVFTAGGHTFYIDTAISRLPLSEKFSARLPLFTGFPSEMTVLSAKDSGLLRDIVNISQAIARDSFRMALIEQVDIDAQRNFEMIPKIGNAVIVFGDASEAEEKFDRLRLFYKNIMPKAGLNYYSSINLQFRNQVVAKRRGAEDFTADSLRTLQMLQEIEANAARQAEDSSRVFAPDNSSNTTDSTMILQSVERNDVESSTERTIQNDPLPPTNANKPVTTTPVVTHPANVPATPKPVVTRPVNHPKPADKPQVQPPKPKPKPVQQPPPRKKPGAQMPKRNDY